MNIKARSNQSGFTLVELLVVITIVGILATLVLLQLSIARGRARDTKRIADISQIRSAIELYYNDRGHYPESSDMTILQTLGYIERVPSDPFVGISCGNDFSGTVSGGYNCYGYAWFPNTNPTSFQVWTELEYKSGALNADADIDSLGWSGAQIEGSDEVDCSTDTPQDCLYDIGQQ